MKLGIFFATIFFASAASAQSDTAFKQRVHRILSEYSKDFKGFIGKQKLSGSPKRLFVEPGLQDGIDIDYIFGDTLLSYSSVIEKDADSSSARKTLMRLDKLLQNSLGARFIRQAATPSFSKEQEVPLTFKSPQIEVYVIVSHLFNPNKCMIALVFKGHTQNK